MINYFKNYTFHDKHSFDYQPGFSSMIFNPSIAAEASIGGRDAEKQ